MNLNTDLAVEKYAGLIVHVGLNLRAGQRLVIQASIEAQELVRAVAASAYQAGARLVDVFWNDEKVTLARYRFAPRDSFTEFPAYRTTALAEYAKNGDAVLSIYAEDPDLLQGQDPELIQTAQQVGLQHSQDFIKVISQNGTNWCIVSIPIPSWAAKVFPDLPTREAEQRLWDAIFKVNRLDVPDPVAAWQTHLNGLLQRAATLNRKAYRSLHLKAPGTDLRIGLPEGHRWVSAKITAANGISFTPNMPTEEIFTMPHREQVEGVVRSTRPLSYAGTLIEDFTLTFKDGRVSEFRAVKGEETLKHLLETDEGARRLGEVALVPHSSPVSQSGILFYNTLFDENAACHLALGRALHFSIEGGEEMEEAAFQAAGGNISLTHVDFMVGSDQIEVDGITADGVSEAILRAGEWAFEP